MSHAVILGLRIIAYALVKGAQLEEVTTASTVSDMSAAKGGRSYAEKDREGCSSEDRPSSAGSRSCKIISTQQLEFTTLKAQL
jgi:hypothetical protein